MRIKSIALVTVGAYALAAYAIYKFIQDIEVSYDDWYWDQDDWEDQSEWTAERWAEYWGEDDDGGE